MIPKTTYNDTPFAQVIDDSFREFTDEVRKQAAQDGDVSFTRAITSEVKPPPNLAEIKENLKTETDYVKIAEIIKKAYQAEVTVVLRGDFLAVLNELNFLLKDDSFYHKAVQCVEGSIASQKVDFIVDAMRLNLGSRPRIEVVDSDSPKVPEAGSSN